MMRYIRIAVAVVAIALLVWQVGLFKNISNEYSSDVATTKVQQLSALKQLVEEKKGSQASNSENRSKAYYELNKLADEYAGKRFSAWTNIGAIILGAGVVLYSLRD